MGRGKVGGVVYSGGQEMKIFGTGFQHFEKRKYELLEKIRRNQDLK